MSVWWAEVFRTCCCSFFWRLRRRQPF